MTISAAGVAAVVYLIFFIYLGVYGFANPDPAHAYFIDGVNKPALTREAAISLAAENNVTVRTGYPVDMGHMFRTWFLWGFWASAFTIAFYVAAILSYIFGKEGKSFSLIKIIGGIIYAVTCCNTAAWFLLGFFWRFSKAGRICSGERLERPESGDINEFLKSQSEADGYQIKGGKFMSVFLWLVIVLVLVSIAVLSVLAADSCMVGEESDIETYKPAASQQQQ